MSWIDAVPRHVLGHWPTPLEPLANLSEALGGPRIWLKRDDCSGLATGGNKTRKLEFLIAEAIGRGADSVVTFGAVQSNHARQTAAACARAGLSCDLILSRRVDWPNARYEQAANVLIDRLCGANVHIFDLDALETGTRDVIDNLRHSGRNPYVIPAGGSNSTGALGYVRCAQELLSQAGVAGFDLSTVVHASSSAGTQSGMLFGLRSFGSRARVQGINVYHATPGRLHDTVGGILTDLLKHYPDADVAQSVLDDIEVEHGYLGADYGQPTAGTLEAIQLAASCEGVLFDPVYSGKALAGLIDQVRRGRLVDDDVVLIHTGGAVTLNVYEDAFAAQAP